MSKTAEADLLQTPLQYLKGVGPRKAADFARAGLVTVEDLLFRFPLRYEDRSRLQPIASLREGQTTSVLGQVTTAGLRPTRRPGLRIFEALIRDQSGTLRVSWFNAAYLKDQIKPGLRLVVYGTFERNPWAGLQMTNPQFEAVDGDEAETLHTGRIVPVYERVRSITPKMERRFVGDVLAQLPADLPDPLPAPVRAALAVPARRDALAATHFPPAGESLEVLNAFRTHAQRRLILEEFFRFQVGLLLRRREADGERKEFVIRVDDRVRQALRDVLPFHLTPGQRRALKEIGEDMQRPRPMNRLLQGDVGSGKTIVAVLAAVLAMENGRQVAFMAPTEILAEQHYQTIRALVASTRFKVALMTGAGPAATRRALVGQVAAGHIDLVVGTHAIVQEQVAFKALGLAVVDEQHRFGVLQRATLRAKGLRPDMLVMTATPIPRTLALTTYGDLDVSSIRELPPGRQPIRTVARPDSKRDEVYALVRRELDAGRQAYVVYPIIEESEKVGSPRGHGDGRPPLARDLPGVPRGAAARAHEGAGQGPGHACLRVGRDPDPRRDDRDRGRRGRAECVRDARGACRAVRPGAAPPAARPHRPRRPPVDRGARVSVPAQRAGRRAAEGDDADDRRLRDRGKGSRAAGLRRSLRDPPVGRAGAPARRSPPRSRPDGRGA